HFQDKDFDRYEHLGYVHPPPTAKVRKGRRVSQRSDASAESGRTYQSAKDVLEQFGFDPNTVIHVPECDDQCAVHPHAADGLLSVEHDVVPAKSKPRDWAYTDSVVVKEWLIDTGCGNDLLSKRDVASVH
ncbi:MAG: hypothetical protein ACKPKO_18780, partial [Candidatus Fonsibacter sp.]